MLPNFIIAGATRSGTTSLYYYLKQHPEISFPDLKEPRYFSSMKLTLPQHGPGDYTVDEKLLLNFEDYKKLYDGIDNKIVGDASSEYLSHYEYTASEIFRCLGDIPIVIILRNPVERAFSAYNNLVRDGREKLTFEDALEAEEERIKDNWDIMWAYKYVGLYAKQVNEFMKMFTRVRIIIFEEFIKDPSAEIKEILEFLNVNSEVMIDTSITYSHSGKPKTKIIGWLSSRNHSYIYSIRTFVFELIPRRYLEKIASGLFAKEEISEITRKKLIEFFESDIAELEKVIDKDLSIWKTYAT